MLQSLMPLIILMSWLALPVTLICIVDDWFLRPRRTLAAAPGAQVVRDGTFMTLLYSALPVLIIAAVLRLLLAERLDFSAVLLAITVLTGVVWACDARLFRPRREAAARAAGRDPAQVPEPGTVDYARSFFPVALVVLVLRSFIFEPFRIPSDSMMPTLLDGDFIVVNKYAYGLRLPVINSKIVAIDEPHRGDVIVFRLPSDPSTNYIKRLVGLPGDHIVVRDRQVFVNGERMPVRLDGIYQGHGHTGAKIGFEQLGTVEHRVLYLMDRYTRDFEQTVPEGHYFFMGDNRDNSRDSRFPEVGFVPERNLVGKAVRIWLNWDWPDAPLWSRIGDPIR